MSEDEPTFEEVDQYHMALDEIARLRAALAEAEAYLHGYRMADKMTGRESSMDAEIDAWLARRSET